MRTLPTIYLGDFAEALARLAPADTAARQAVAALLGFEWREPAPTVEKPVLPIEPPPAVPPPDESPGNTVKQPPPPSPPPPRDETRWLPSTLETETAALPALSPEELFSTLPPLPEDPQDAASLPVEPLFRSEWTRSILMALLATSRAGEVDFACLGEQLGTGRPLERLPRLPWPTLRRGVQVLLDVGPAMTPFAQDQAWLLAQIRLVAGREQTRLARFTRSPRHGAGTGLAARWRPWTPPTAGTPVLVVSDLGAGPGNVAGQAATEVEWLDFAALARRSGCPVVALVPAGAARFSPALHRALHVVPWDRHTTAGRLRRIIGRTLHVD